VILLGCDAEEEECHLGRQREYELGDVVPEGAHGLKAKAGVSPRMAISMTPG
jgi:hypothetical protein